jgi:hypothetical protein
MTHLREEHFTGPFLPIYQILSKYYLFTNNIVPDTHFTTLAQRMGLEEELFKLDVTTFPVLKQPPQLNEGEFRYNIVVLKDQTKRDRLVGRLVDAMDVLQTGKRLQLDGKMQMLTGYDGAVKLLQSGIVDIDRIDTEGANTVWLNTDVTNVLSDYSARKHGRKGRGLPTGFDDIDEQTSGGFQPTDLVFLPAFTSEGKSTLLYTLLDQWVHKCSRNCVLASAESSLEVCQRRMVCVRSADRKYGQPEPLNYKRLKEGRLSHEEEKFLEMVVQDMNNNPNYGKLAMFRIPRKSTVSGIFSRLGSINQVVPLDAFGWDYINYSTSDVKRGTDREEGTHTVREAKVSTGDFGINGLLTVSPFQVARHRYETALKEGRYTLTCMAEVSEAEKAADIVWSILRIKEGNTVGQLLKNRDGPRKDSPFEMDFDSIAQRYVPKVKPKGSIGI